MKKAERKKQLRERIIMGIALACNLVWIVLLGTKVYANYTAGNYMEYWEKEHEVKYVEVYVIWQ